MCVTATATATIDVAQPFSDPIDVDVLRRVLTGEASVVSAGELGRWRVDRQTGRSANMRVPPSVTLRATPTAAPLLAVGAPNEEWAPDGDGNAAYRLEPLKEAGAAAVAADHSYKENAASESDGDTDTDTEMDPKRVGGGGGGGDPLTRARTVPRPFDPFGDPEALRQVRRLGATLWKLCGRLPFPIANSRHQSVFQFCVTRDCKWWMRVRRRHRRRPHTLLFQTFGSALREFATMRLAEECRFVARPVGLVFVPWRARRHPLRCWAVLSVKVPDSVPTYRRIRELERPDGGPLTEARVRRPARERFLEVEAILARARVVATCLRERLIQVDFEAPDSIVVDCRGAVFIVGIERLRAGDALIPLEQYLAIVDSYARYGPGLGVRGPLGEFDEFSVADVAEGELPPFVPPILESAARAPPLQRPVVAGSGAGGRFASGAAVPRGVRRPRAGRHFR
jgi:hypothetical protein